MRQDEGARIGTELRLRQVTQYAAISVSPLHRGFMRLPLPPLRERRVEFPRRRTMNNEGIGDKPVKGQPGSPRLDPLSSPEVMTMQEAAKFLCISSRTLDRYVRDAAIPYTPLPRRGARAQIRF